MSGTLSTTPVAISSLRAATCSRRRQRHLEASVGAALGAAVTPICRSSTVSYVRSSRAADGEELGGGMPSRVR